MREAVQNEMIACRVNADVAAALKAKAQASGLSLSDFTRRALDDFLHKPRGLDWIIDDPELAVLPDISIPEGQRRFASLPRGAVTGVIIGNIAHHAFTLDPEKCQARAYRPSRADVTFPLYNEDDRIGSITFLAGEAVGRFDITAPEIPEGAFVQLRYPEQVLTDHEPIARLVIALRGF